MNGLEKQPELVLGSSHQQYLVPYNSQPSALSNIVSVAVNALTAIPYYFYAPPLTPEEIERARLATLNQKIKEVQIMELAKRKAFEESWKIVLNSHIKALTINLEAFDILQTLLDSIVKFILKISSNKDFFTHSDNLTMIHTTSPLIETVHSVKEQINYFTTGIVSIPQKKQQVFDLAPCTTLDLMSTLQDSWVQLLQYELERLKIRLQEKIDESERASRVILNCSLNNLKNFNTLDTAFGEREKIQNDLNRYLSKLNQIIPHFLNIDLAKEEMTASKSSYLGWFGSSPSVPNEDNALPEYAKKHLIFKYNEAHRKAINAREEFRRNCAYLTTHAEELKSVLSLLKQRKRDKEHIEFVSGISEEISDIEGSGGEESVGDKWDEEKELKREKKIHVNPLFPTQQSAYPYDFNQYFPSSPTYGAPVEEYDNSSDEEE